MNVSPISQMNSNQTTFQAGKILYKGSKWPENLRLAFENNYNVSRLINADYNVIGRLYTKKSRLPKSSSLKPANLYRIFFSVEKSKPNIFERIKYLLGAFREVPLTGTYHTLKTTINDKLADRPSSRLIYKKFKIEL